MLPRVGARNLVNRLKTVVFPAPFGPMSAWIVPLRTLRFTSLTATKPLNSLARFFVCKMYSASTQDFLYQTHRREWPGVYHRLFYMSETHSAEKTNSLRALLQLARPFRKR